jgi:hypothetical protein
MKTRRCIAAQPPGRDFRLRASAACAVITSLPACLHHRFVAMENSDNCRNKARLSALTFQSVRLLINTPSSFSSVMPDLKARIMVRARRLPRLPSVPMLRRVHSARSARLIIISELSSIGWQYGGMFFLPFGQKHDDLPSDGAHEFSCG